MVYGSSWRSVFVYLFVCLFVVYFEWLGGIWLDLFYTQILPSHIVITLSFAFLRQFACICTFNQLLIRPCQPLGLYTFTLIQLDPERKKKYIHLICQIITSLPPSYSIHQEHGFPVTPLNKLITPLI